ncbi:MAG: biopolymer transporter ExbD [Pseudomonadota bacterium]
MNLGAGIQLEQISRRGRMSLTPMIDIVFLLLIFFMLAATFAEEQNAIRLAPSGGAEDSEGQPYEGAPRLVSIAPDEIKLNGFAVPLADLAEALRPLMPAPDAVVILRPEAGASLQRTVGVIDTLAAAGITAVVLAEEDA